MRLATLIIIGHLAIVLPTRAGTIHIEYYDSGTNWVSMQADDTNSTVLTFTLSGSTGTIHLLKADGSTVTLNSFALTGCDSGNPYIADWAATLGGTAVAG